MLLASCSSDRLFEACGDSTSTLKDSAQSIGANAWLWPGDFRAAESEGHLS
jgi:hypothetical protein